MPRIAAVHQFLMVGALQEPVREAARETVLQLLRVAPGEGRWASFQRRAQRAAVLVHHVGDVLRTLHAALDLEAGDAGQKQLREQIARREIAGGEEILELLVAARRLGAAVDDQIVRHAAALRALAPVGAAVLQSLAGQALAAPAHAERAVDEALQLQICARGHGPDLVDGKLARQHHPRDSERLRHRRGLGGRDGHLGGRMQGELGADLAREPGDAEVLDDDRVRARPRDRRQRLFRHGQLPIEHQRVEGDEALHALRAQEIEDPRQLGGREVVRARARVEAAPQPEIDRIGAGSYRRLEALLVASGREQLRLVQHLGHGE